MPNANDVMIVDELNTVPSEVDIAAYMRMRIGDERLLTRSVRTTFPSIQQIGRRLSSDDVLMLKAFDAAPVPVPAAAPEPVAVVEAPAPVRVRPALPAGVVYVNDTDDWLTMTDLSKVKDADTLFHPMTDDRRTTMLCATDGSGNFSTPSHYSGHYADIYNQDYGHRHLFHIHIIRTPCGLSQHYWEYNSNNPAYSDLVERSHPFWSHSFWREYALRRLEHMVDFSTAHPGYLMYYQDAAKRARGIRTPIKPSRYLKKFFGDVLSEEEIHDIGMEWTNAATPPVLSITQDADEIEAVYRGKYNGSCMHFKHGDHAGPEHPSRAYAGPDLGIAYIGDMDEADGRCLVWPDKKLFYPKMYGDYRRLWFALEAAGWEEGSEDDFVGSRLQRIPHEDDYDGLSFVAPYLDFCEYVRDDGDWLITEFSPSDRQRSVHCRNTNGLTDYLKQHVCSYTGQIVDSEDDLTYVDGYGYVCEEALDEDFFRCVITDDYYHNTDLAPSHPDYPISDYASEAYPSRTFYCENTARYYPTYHFTAVHLANGDTWCQEAFDSDGGVCDFSEECYPDHDLTVLDNGKVIATHLLDLEDPAIREFAGLEPLPSEEDELVAA